MARLLFKGSVAAGLLALAAAAGTACNEDRGGGGDESAALDASVSTSALTGQGYANPPPDLSRVSVRRSPRVQIAYPERSRPLRDLPEATPDAEEREEQHAPMRLPIPHMLPSLERDPVLQSAAPILSMPATILDFAGQGGTLGITPPDTNGAVGPNHYVQVVNSSIEIWNKTGTVVRAARSLSSIWTGYVGTNPGNRCSSSNDGDPVVLYDRLADRWFISEFSLPNASKDNGPNFQCVAVSQTGDPTGVYNLYDYSYPGLNDYGKFGVWPDAYTVTFNMFVSTANPTFLGGDFCAYDRVKMLAGQPAAQQCFQQPSTVGGALPVQVDGKIPPPLGASSYFVEFDYNTPPPPPTPVLTELDVWKLHLDWLAPANTTLTGPTKLTVPGFSPTCAATTTGDCVPEPGANPLAGLDDRMMFRFTYRNFGTHESLLVNHSVVAGAGSGLRWYELRLPGGVPTVFQQGTYAPADTQWRWLGTIAQDQAQGMVMGFSLSNATTNPQIGWTGRLAGDGAGTMGQGESVINSGTGHETGAPRWGDYATMTVDPVDDCTFWFTTEMYNTTGTGSWVTRVASVKYPNCAANDFSISISPATQTVQAGKQITYTVTTAATVGAAEAIALNIQDLPTGVTGAFVPATVTAGTPSTLTLTAAAGAPTTGVPAPTFTVIGKAPSAVELARAQVAVAPPTVCGNGVIEAGEQCDDGAATGTAGDCCTATTCQYRASTFVCRAAANACDAAETCTGSAAVCPPDVKQANGTPCPDGTVCNGAETCQAGVCTAGTALACDDGKPCTTDSCDAVAGCQHANVADGTTCNDNNACTTSDACQAGACTGAAVACTAKDECHLAGTCAAATGVCSNPAKPDGTACSIGTCQSGTCSATPANDAGSDSGGPGDSGPGADSGGPGPGSDSGAGPSADAAGDAGGGAPGDSGGCSCRVVETRSTPSWAILGPAGLALLGLRRRARRRGQATR